jgi:hypothetical protein
MNRRSAVKLTSFVTLSAALRILRTVAGARLFAKATGEYPSIAALVLVDVVDIYVLLSLFEFFYFLIVLRAAFDGIVMALARYPQQ